LSAALRTASTATSGSVGPAGMLIFGFCWPGFIHARSFMLPNGFS
jgi:hypothetical protein